MGGSFPRWVILFGVATLALLAIVLTAPLVAISADGVRETLHDSAIRSSIWRTLWTSILSAATAVVLAVPTAYWLTSSSRWRSACDAAVETVLAMPPLVVGLCLLLLFRQGLLKPLDDAVGVTLSIGAVVLAQVFVALALAVRLLQTAFDRLPQDTIAIARSLGGSPSFVFRRVVLPVCRGEVAAAGLLAWARAFGEFGPVLLFAGVTRFETEVLSTSIHLEMSGGRVGVAAALAVGMMSVALCVTVAVRAISHRSAQFDRQQQRLR